MESCSVPLEPPQDSEGAEKTWLRFACWVVVENHGFFSPNGGLMVIYHGRLGKTSP